MTAIFLKKSIILAKFVCEALSRNFKAAGEAAVWGQKRVTDLSPVFKQRVKNGFPDYTLSGFTQKPCVVDPGTFKVPEGTSWHSIHCFSSGYLR